MLGIQPHGFWIERILFREVYRGIAVIHAFERKHVRQILARHYFAIVLGRPAQQAYKIDKRLRQKTGIAIRSDADHRSMLALRKLRSIWRDQQRQMSKVRRSHAQSLED